MADKQIVINGQSSRGISLGGDTRGKAQVASNSGVTDVIMKIPNGTKYKLTVADDGTISTAAVT